MCVCVCVSVCVCLCVCLCVISERFNQEKDKRYDTGFFFGIVPTPDKTLTKLNE